MQTGNRWYGKGSRKVLKIAEEVLNETPEVDKKIKCVELLDKYGAMFVKDAFGVARSTVYLWKKQLEEEGLKGLRNKSRAPIHVRKPETDERIIEYIQQYRTDHPGVCKKIIEPELKQYCKEIGIKSVSESTVGRIIKRLKEARKIDNKKKLRMDVKTGELIEIIPKKKKKKDRLKKKDISQPGEVMQVDAIHYNTVPGNKMFALTAIDRVSRIAHVKVFSKLNSRIATEFLKEVIKESPYKIKAIQTDNGLEFEKNFDGYIKSNKMIHYYNYPHSPKSNAYVERFNRTVQE
jgi:transposase